MLKNFAKFTGNEAGKALLDTPSETLIGESDIIGPSAADPAKVTFYILSGEREA